MRELGYGIHAASQIGGKHLQAFTRRRTSEGIGARTLVKEMSQLRAVLRHVDKHGLAANAGYANRAPGIGRGSVRGPSLRRAVNGRNGVSDDGCSTKSLTPSTAMRPS